MTPRRVLITGGAGFLGGHVARRFRRDGFEVRLLDLTGGQARHAEGAETLRGDVRDRRAVGAALDGVDVVVHAAFASPRQRREVIRSVNVEGTRHVCEEAVARGVARVILVSSTIVSASPRRHPVLRDSPVDRLDAYRVSRIEAEALAGDAARRGLSIAVARPKTFVGPERVGAFGLVFEWIRLGRPVIVLGRGRNRYQLLDPRDMAEGLLRLAASDAGGVFFFGAREFRSVREDLQALIDHAGTGSRLRFVPAPLARAALHGLELAGVVPASEWHYMTAAGRDSVVDLSRAEIDLGWRPASSNAGALIDAYDWYVETMRARGQAPLTHPIPRAHRVLSTLAWMLPG